MPSPGLLLTIVSIIVFISGMYHFLFKKDVGKEGREGYIITLYIGTIGSALVLVWAFIAFIVNLFIGKV